MSHPNQNYNQRLLKLKTETPYLNRIQLATNRRSRLSMPTIISASCYGTLINKKAPYPPEDECMKPSGMDGNLIPTNKLSLKGYGDWDFSAIMVKASNFLSRDDFDYIMLETYKFSPSLAETIIPQVFPKIELIDGFNQVEVTLHVNMEHMLETAKEEQKARFETNCFMYGEETVEKIVLDSFLGELFGKADGKSRDLVDFRRYKCSNACYGTGQYGQNYISLEFQTS